MIFLDDRMLRHFVCCFLIVDDVFRHVISMIRRCHSTSIESAEALHDATSNCKCVHFTLNLHYAMMFVCSDVVTVMTEEVFFYSCFLSLDLPRLAFIGCALSWNFFTRALGALSVLYRYCFWWVCVTALQHVVLRCKQSTLVLLAGILMCCRRVCREIQTWWEHMSCLPFWYVVSLIRFCAQNVKFLAARQLIFVE